MLLLVLFLSACADDVAAPEGLAEPFAVYGILNPTSGVQTLLVSPVDPLLKPLGETIDAAVTSTDLQSGRVYTWRDSVITNETGQLEHVFVSHFTPDYGSRHRIKVLRSDGQESTVDVSIPGRVRIEGIDTGTRHVQVAVEGDDVRVVRFDITYVVRLYDARADTLGPLGTFTVSQQTEQLKKGGGWQADINMDEHYGLARSAYYSDHRYLYDAEMGTTNCERLGLFEMKVLMTVGSEEWNPPGGSFDPTVLGQPNVLRNVENGFGFVGGGYDAALSLYPSAESLEDTWFFDFVQGRHPTISSCS